MEDPYATGSVSEQDKEEEMKEIDFAQLNAEKSKIPPSALKININANEPEGIDNS